MPERHADRRAKIVLLILLVLALVSVAALLTLGAKGSWAFVLKFRGVKLFSLLLVAYAIAVSTVLFQTVTNNRILTPSVMGFDSLYVLVQTVLFFTIGSGAVAMLDPQVKFLAEAASGDVQLLMARWTGAYRFGNERQARNHPRNQGGRTRRG